MPKPTLNVIVADDVPEVREQVRSMLASIGITPRLAFDGDMAWQMVERMPVDVLITDIVMPGHDPFELIGEARRLHPNAKIIAMSGGGAYAGVSDCLMLAKFHGATETIEKPFVKARLLELVTAESVSA